MRLTTKQFIEKAKIVHPNKYDYSLVEYKDSKTKVNIICPKHSIFQIRPNNLLNGQECQRCAIEIRSAKRALTKDEFISKANLIHNYKYNYNNINYKNCVTKIIINCPIHGDFKQTPNSHTMGQSGCPKCNHKPTYSKTEWITMCNNKTCTPLVYIIRCFNKTEEFIKIGITSNTVKYRFKQKTSLPYSYEILREIKGSPDFVFDKEHELHRLYKEYKYQPLIHFNGETECFNISISTLL